MTKQPSVSSNVDQSASCKQEEPVGPTREGGGTTGEGNLTAQQANRTGGATSGVPSEPQPPRQSGAIPPDA